MANYYRYLTLSVLWRKPESVKCNNAAREAELLQIHSSEWRQTFVVVPTTHNKANHKHQQAGWTRYARWLAALTLKEIDHEMGIY